MTKLEFSIDVSDQLARDAREAGLLSPGAITEMLQDGIRKKAIARIRAARNAPNEDRPMTLGELQKIVKTVRKQRD